MAAKRLRCNKHFMVTADVVTIKFKNIMLIILIILLFLIFYFHAKLDADGRLVVYQWY